MEGKNSFKVSFIKALTPHSRLKVKKRIPGKNEGLKRVFLRENSSKVSFFCPAKCHKRLWGGAGSQNFRHTPERFYLPTTKASNDSELYLRIVQKQPDPPGGGKGRSLRSHGDENGPSQDQGSEQGRAGECSSFLLFPRKQSPPL